MIFVFLERISTQKVEKKAVKRVGREKKVIAYDQRYMVQSNFSSAYLHLNKLLKTLYRRGNSFYCAHEQN